MRPIFGFRTWKTPSSCQYLYFNDRTQSEERQGYVCNLTHENRCVGHVTLPIPYLDFKSIDYDFTGLYSTLDNSIVMRCPSRKEINKDIETLVADVK